MIYVVGQYWLFLLLAAVAGIGVGWWFQSPRSVDQVTAWLERGTEEP